MVKRSPETFQFVFGLLCIFSATLVAGSLAQKFAGNSVAGAAGSKVPLATQLPRPLDRK